MSAYWIVVIFVLIIVVDAIVNKIDVDLTLTRNIKRVFNTWPEKIALNLFLFGLALHFTAKSGVLANAWTLVAFGVPGTSVVIWHNFRRH